MPATWIPFAEGINKKFLYDSILVTEWACTTLSLSSLSHPHNLPLEMIHYVSVLLASNTGVMLTCCVSDMDGDHPNILRGVTDLYDFLNVLLEQPFPPIKYPEPENNHDSADNSDYVPDGSDNNDSCNESSDWMEVDPPPPVALQSGRRERFWTTARRVSHSLWLSVFG